MIQSTYYYVICFVGATAVAAAVSDKRQCIAAVFAYDVPHNNNNNKLGNHFSQIFPIFFCS